MPARKTIAQFVAASGRFCLSLVLVFVAFNVICAAILASFPGLFRAPGDIINLNFERIRREYAAKGSNLLDWYGVKSLDEITGLWSEFAATAVRYSPYLQFEMTPFRGRFYSISDAGYRNSRVDGPWPPAKENINLFFFGGSTAQGQTSNATTIASYLQQALQASVGKRSSVFVYNFGRSSYQSTQEKLLLQQLLGAGQVPHIAVFFDGLNDFCFADGKPSGWQTVESLYNQYHEEYLRRIKGNAAGIDWRRGGEFAMTLPMVRLAEATATRLSAAPPNYTPPDQPRHEPIEFNDPRPDDADLRNVISRYRENVRQLRAIADQYKVRPFFVWQPIPTYKYDLRYHAFLPDRLYCHINSKFGYPMMAEAAGRESIDPDFIWAADMQEGLKENLYVDAVHYTAPMSRRIGELIAREIVARTPDLR